MSAAAAPVPAASAEIQAADQACTQALRAFLRTDRGTPEADQALERYRHAVQTYDVACGRPPREPRVVIAGGVIR